MKIVLKTKTIEHLKTDFISILSHELRTPITIIKTSLILLKQTGLAPQIQKQIIEHALRSIGRLTKSANDVTDLANLQMKNFVFKKELFTIQKAINPLIDYFHIDFVSKNISLKTHIPHDLPTLLGDLAQTQKALSKLIDNAIKFSKHGGRVLITVSSNTPCSVKITIEDSGCGIPKHKIDHIQKRFEQAQDSLTRNTNGLGLGLPLAKELITLQGGSFYIHSRQKKGTRVSISLPTNAKLHEENKYEES